MLTMSNRAAERLREELVHKCFEMGVGFRMLVNSVKSGETTFSIKLDKQHKEDEVIDSDGVRVFLDPTSVARISGYELDYEDKPGGRFYLKTIEEVKGGCTQRNGAMPKAKV